MKEWFTQDVVGSVREFYKRFDGERSPDWQRVRNAFVRSHKNCACCGADKGLNVHHIVPFQVAPHLELRFDNLITLCRKCHFIVGHLRTWHSWNETVVTDSEYMLEKIRRRPTVKKVKTWKDYFKF